MSRISPIAAALTMLACVPTPTPAGDHFLRPTVAPPQTHERAGHPLLVSRLAHPSDTGHYSGGLIGGGKAIVGRGRCEAEGTWGWDYTPFRPSGRGIFLDWSRGRANQGGTGRYATDGPHPLHAISEAIHGDKD